MTLIALLVLGGCEPADRMSPDEGGSADTSADTSTDTSADTSTDCDVEWYTDADGDGWGDTSTRTTGCEAPAGSAARGGDCDDTDAAASPSTADDWGDGIDSDCSGGDGVEGATNVQDDGTSHVAGGGDALGAGRSLLAADPDGDGAAELLVGGDDVIVIVPLPLVVTDFGAAPCVLLGEGIGGALARADRGDGTDALLLRAGDQVAIVEAITTGVAQVEDSARALTVTGDLPFSDLDAGSDVDGDGIDDVLVVLGEFGPLSELDGWGYYPVSYEARLMLGPVADILDLGGDRVWEGRYDWYRSLEVEGALPGDLDGDGYGEVTVSMGSTKVFSMTSDDEVGDIWDDSRAIPAGDVDGDDRADLVVIEESAVSVYSGPIVGSVLAASVSVPGEALAGAVVSTSDGPFLGVGTGDAMEGRYGSLYAAPSGSGVTRLTAADALYGPDESAAFGEVLLGLDVTGDGAEELLAGAPDQGDEGAVYVISLP